MDDENDRDLTIERLCGMMPGSKVNHLHELECCGYVSFSAKAGAHNVCTVHITSDGEDLLLLLSEQLYNY